MVHFCEQVVGPEGIKCGLRIDAIGLCPEHQKKASAAVKADAEKSDEPALAAPKRKGS